MENKTLFDFTDDENEDLDKNSLSSDAKILYDGYCKIIGLDKLPNSDFLLLEEAVKTYFVHNLIEFIKGSVKSDSYSMKKALNDGRIKDFAFYYVLIKKVLGATDVKKDNYNRRFKSLPEFLKAFGNHDIFNIINTFLLDGGVNIKDDDLQELSNIIQGYDIIEVEEGLKRCNKNGIIIRNVKFLSKVLQGLKEELEFNKQKWDKDNKDADLHQEILKMEEFYSKQEIIKRENEENNDSVIFGLLKDIALLKEQGNVK